MSPDSDQPGLLGIDAQIGMFSEEWKAANAQLVVVNLLHFGDFQDIIETAGIQEQLERRILKLAVTASRNNDVPNLVPKLKHRLEQHVVLMAMGNQDVIY